MRSTCYVQEELRTRLLQQGEPGRKGQYQLYSYALGLRHLRRTRSLDSDASPIFQIRCGWGGEGEPRAEPRIALHLTVHVWVMALVWARLDVECLGRDHTAARAGGLIDARWRNERERPVGCSGTTEYGTRLRSNRRECAAARKRRDEHGTCTHATDGVGRALRNLCLSGE